MQVVEKFMSYLIKVCMVYSSNPLSVCKHMM
jgi:hypothetical protein